ncbi:class I SAM-dependent methyltransferase [Rossellomorea oryzaecorticis]|uniref:Class I SAM-dependent methyltransferase n=1 Tax=Rossellomorea oryzaecorticis TaxID=1396505 RepID=A0ABW8VRZ0_9BACI
MIKDSKFLNLIKDVDRSFKGWDFSFISGTGRMSSGLLSWSYGSQAISLIQGTNTMLDMGTGGGEFLSMLRPFPQTVFATEGYKPNIAIAKERLEPMGVTVVPIDEDTKLPFENEQFDLILNQHESYSPKELRRIIKENGSFLTQQVGGLDCVGINEALGVFLNNEFLNWNLKSAKNELEKNSFQVLYSQEEFPFQRFYDVGALVYYLKAIPWQVPGFSVKRFENKLYDIHKIIQEKGFFEVKQHRFMIKAKAL